MNAKPEMSRWTQGSEAPEGLLRLMEASRGALGTQAEVAALAQRLSLVLGPAAGLPQAPEHAPAQPLESSAPERLVQRRPLTSAHWLAGVTGGVVTGVAIWWSSSVGPVKVPAPEPAASSSSFAPQPSLPAAAAPLAAAPPLQPARSEAKRAAPPPTQRKRPAAPAGPSEAELLERAELALSTDPGRALALTREHLRRFPEGALAEEREVIAIAALERTGQKQAAAAKAQAFARRYRGSVHETRLENSPGRRPTHTPQPPRLTPK
jgi:hypothetical protein